MDSRLLLLTAICLLTASCAPKTQVGNRSARAEESIAAQAPEHILPNGAVEIGNPEAPLSLLVITNHSCSYCSEFQKKYLPRLLREFILPGHLRVSFMELFLKKYPESATAAAALFCAGTQGKGAEMNEQLFSGNQLPSLDEPAFSACMETKETKKIVEEQQKWIKGLDVKYVPTFILNGEKFVGLPEYADLRGRIENSLVH